MYERLCCSHPGLASSPDCNYLVMLLPDARTVLAHMSEQRVLLCLQHGRNIHVGVGKKSLSLAAAVYFEKIDMRLLPKTHASANCQHAGYLMVHVRVDGPMSEDHVRLFGGKQFGHGFNMRPSDLSRPIDLTKEH